METVVLFARFCTMIWLPRLRTSTKPWRARTSQTSAPDRTRSLANGDLNLRDVDISAQTVGNFGFRSRFEEEF